ncbi:hypothetical protein SGLAD_v1c05280 [Spiroplasma gladiatoris]|uniref:Uncharacterized protein n=1 Tax=Spiroplasma gladiatoris TaxID=2143 RepID=A0A4P7AHN2_9MOLU|nr:hypothetical protein [Spiroplasma gladiatoris]QBQ07727.1 hypothetical protein SGLAD_v1c05280 [Spiroplasma gladiatoris]
MEIKVTKYKQSVLKILIVSIILFVISIIATSVLFAIDIRHIRSWTTGIIALLLVLSIMLFVAVLCGSIFLIKNRKIDDIERLKVKKALDFGLFYFKVSLNIDKSIDNKIKEENAKNKK